MWSINSVYTWNRHGASFILLLPLFFVSSHKPVVYPSSQRRHPTWLRCLWICLWRHKTAGVWWNGWIRKVQQRSLWTTGNLSGSHVIYSALKKKETFSAVVRLDANIVLVSVMQQDYSVVWSCWVREVYFMVYLNRMLSQQTVDQVPA